MYKKISIILVCYNSVKTIEQTIQSIIHLDYPNLEFIVIDGKSTDGTVEVLHKYSEHIDQLISEKDNGIYHAMNKGIKIAQGDYFYFIGSDDVIINSWNLLMGKLISKNTIYYGNVYFPSSNRTYDGKFNSIKLLTKNICHQAIFYPRSVFDKYQFSEDYPLLADFHLNLILNSDKSFKFKYLNFLVAIYSEKGISNNKSDRRFLEDHIKIMNGHYSFVIYFYIYVRKILSKYFTNKKL